MTLPYAVVAAVIIILGLALLAGYATPVVNAILLILLDLSGIAY
jgi:hypothetical protein